MSTVSETSAFDRGIDPLFRLLTLDQARVIAEFRGDDALRARIDELADKCNEGDLTAEERVEYEGYVRANTFLAVLQAKARNRLREP